MEAVLSLERAVTRFRAAIDDDVRRGGASTCAVSVRDAASTCGSEPASVNGVASRAAADAPFGVSEQLLEVDRPTCGEGASTCAALGSAADTCGGEPAPARSPVSDRHKEASSDDVFDAIDFFERAVVRFHAAFDEEGSGGCDSRRRPFLQSLLFDVQAESRRVLSLVSMSPSLPHGFVEICGGIEAAVGGAESRFEGFRGSSLKSDSKLKTFRRRR